MENIPDVVPAMAVRHRFKVYRGKSRYLRHFFRKDKCTWECDYYAVVISTSVVAVEINKGLKPTDCVPSLDRALQICERVKLG